MKNDYQAILFFIQHRWLQLPINPRRQCNKRRKKNKKKSKEGKFEIE